jgi:hypothetical protein
LAICPVNNQIMMEITSCLFWNAGYGAKQLNHYSHVTQHEFL